MPNKTYKAYCPIWNYQATGINWNYSKRLWNNESFPQQEDCKKIPEGIKLNFIISIASVIEGSLKNYLISKLNYSLNRRKLIDEELLNGDNDTEESAPTFKKSKDELREELEAINRMFNEIASSYLMVRKVKKCKFSFLGNSYQFEYKISSNSKKVNDEYIEKYIEIIKKDTWNELISHFRSITGERLKVSLKKIDKKLTEDIEKIFQFRNFIIHSNNIEIEHDTKNVKYEGDVKKLIEYIDDKSFSAPADKHYFIEKLIPDDLVEHFKKCADNFLKCTFFSELFDTINLKNQIWTE